MKVLIPGHHYELDLFDYVPNFFDINPVLQFIQKEADESGELKTVRNGTTNEEVLAVLIDRLTFLNNRFPCLENEQALLALTVALGWLNKRTANRKERGVEGKNLV